MTTARQLQSVAEVDLVLAVSEVAGLAVLSALLAGTVALGYRWYAREQIQFGLPVLVGLSGVALYRGATTALGQVISGAPSGTNPLAPETAVFNVVTFLVGGLAAAGAVVAGDRLGATVFAAATGHDFEGDVSRVVEAVGRVISVDLPEEIDDIVGYDPVPEETKAKLSGRTFLFPKRLTVAELAERLRTRLKTDYGVSHVDVELAADGSVEYLAVGVRAAGIGPTLAPETAAVAVRADPAFAASAGDIVQVWEPDAGERVATAELRGIAGDVVTLAVDAADAGKLDADTRYRLVTLSVDGRPDREFASLLRAADETMGIVTVEAGSQLVGQPVGALDVSVVAVRPTTGDIEAIPTRGRVLDVGEAVYAVAKPAALRKLEAAASAPGSAAAVEPPAEDD